MSDKNSNIAAKSESMDDFDLMAHVNELRDRISRLESQLSQTQYAEPNFNWKPGDVWTELIVPIKAAQPRRDFKTIKRLATQYSFGYLDQNRWFIDQNRYTAFCKRKDFPPLLKPSD